jgi:hypothetical protein
MGGVTLTVAGYRQPGAERTLNHDTLRSQRKEKRSNMFYKIEQSGGIKSFQE